MNLSSSALGFPGPATMVTTPRTAAEALVPPSPASVVLLRGDPVVRAVTLEVAARALMAKHDLLWVEGGNRFELATLAETAHRWMVDPRLLLRRLRQLGHRLLIACPDPPEGFRGEDLGRVLEQVATRTVFFRNAEEGVWLHEQAPPQG